MEIGTLYFSSSALNPHKLSSLLIRPSPNPSPRISPSSSSWKAYPILNDSLMSIRTHHGKLKPIINCKSCWDQGLESNNLISVIDLMSKEWVEKCEGKELVEVLECLEEEAMKIGDDEGREPIDYNRRAHIFDTCSRVFQGLKERDAHTPSPSH